MMRQDSYGNAIEVGSQLALERYDRGMRLFLGAEFGATEAFQAAIDEDEHFALGHAALARSLMMSGLMPQAKAAIDRAQTLVAHLDHRQRRHVECLALLFSGEPHKARALVKAHVHAHPRDVLVAQTCSNVFGLIGFSGEVGREADLLAYTSALLPHYGEDWWMMSMHALALCETGQIEKSASLMERSLALNPRNANAAHFKAHAQYEAGNIKEGRTYLSNWLAGYDDRAVLHGHLSWHSALWALHDGDEAAMWLAVDAGVGPGAAKGLPINVLTDTAAILYRAELAGLAVDRERWMALSDYAARCFPQTGQSFADIHAALSHAMAGQGDRLAHIAQNATGFADDLVRPMARAWGAIARENWSEALDELIQVMGSTERLGGSRAQRDLLELTYVNVLLKQGLTAEAQRCLITRRPVLAASPPIGAYPRH
jgi:tetratricopeptide (TPR) repeat protein